MRTGTGKFKGRLVCDPLNQGLEEASVKELLRDFLTPIASGTISVDEDLIESFPRDRLHSFHSSIKRTRVSFDHR